MAAQLSVSISTRASKYRGSYYPFIRVAVAKAKKLFPLFRGGYMCFFIKISSKSSRNAHNPTQTKGEEVVSHQSSQEIIVFETFADRLLREQSERQQTTRVSTNPTDERKNLQRSKPLQQQIHEYIDSLPPLLRERPITMAEIVNQLTGRYRDKPHPQHVGAALRALGYKDVRLWGKQGEGKRVWLPHIDGGISLT